MDELLVRHARRETTERERAAVKEWLDGSPERERELAELRLMVEAGRTADRRIVAGDAPDAADVIWRAEARLADCSGSPPARLGRRVGLPRRRLWLDLAAVGVVALAATFAAQVVIVGAGRGVRSVPAVQEFATGPGETEMVRLGDGTVIRLGPESRLSAAVGETVRDATLQGEAFFAVAADEDRPFRIVTAAGTARVLGTRFHLAARGDELAATVVEGRVALAGPDHEVQIGAGQATSLLGGVPAAIESAAPIERVAGWMDAFLIFHDTPLEAAMREVERRYDTEVVVADDALRERTLTMWFDSKSLPEVMTVVCGVVGASCSIDAGVVRIESDLGGEAP